MFNHFHSLYPKSVVFSVVPGFQSTVPLVAIDHEPEPSMEPNLPPSLLDYYDAKYLNCSETELSVIAIDICDKLKVTQEEADFLETSTREQSVSTVWHDYRKGRITASHFHEVLRYTGKSYPNSIVKSIMQYRNFNQNIPALKWGRENEENARKEYLMAMEGSHTNVQVRSSGLVINPSYPFLGASPDGIVVCDCCGEGLIEIKCTYKYRHDSPTSSSALADHHYFLKDGENGDIHLSSTHQYYDQVQGQLGICDVKFCDFVCWTTKGLFIERIFQDKNYLTSKLPQFRSFFCKYLLPEILTHKLYLGLESQQSVASQPAPTTNHVHSVSSQQTHPTIATSQDGQSVSSQPTANQDDVYCLCRKQEYGEMVACDNCDEWFHFPCVGLESEPVGDWYCPTCVC